MGLLNGQISDAIWGGFKGKLLTAALRQEVPASSGGLDEFGDPMDVGVLLTATEGFTARYSDYFAAQAGYPETDLKCCLFARPMNGIRPGKDDKIKIVRAGVEEWYQVREAKIDPAGALWICRSFSIPDPS